MEPTARVVESEMLKDRLTGKEREVDVVIHAKIAGHSVLVGVEATALADPASVEWVDRMSGKHNSLPTDKLILVSESGFSAEAITKASALGIVTISPDEVKEEDLTPEAWERIQRNSTYRAGMVVPSDLHAELLLRLASGYAVARKGTGQTRIFLEDRTSAGTLDDCLRQYCTARLGDVLSKENIEAWMEGTPKPFRWDISDFTFNVSWGKDDVRLGEQSLPLYMHTADEIGTVEVFAKIEHVAFICNMRMEVLEVDLTHHRFDQALVSHGGGVWRGEEFQVVQTRTPQGVWETLDRPSQKVDVEAMKELLDSAVKLAAQVDGEPTVEVSDAQ
jgi:hypothetical protein